MALNYGGYKSKKQADEEKPTLTQLRSVCLLREPVPGNSGVKGPPALLIVTPSATERLRLAQGQRKRSSEDIAVNSLSTLKDWQMIRNDIRCHHTESNRSFFASLEIEKSITKARGGLGEHHKSMLARLKKDEKRSHLLSRDSLFKDDDDVLGYFPFPARGNFWRESLSQCAVYPDRDPKNLNRGGSVASSSVQTQGGGGDCFQ